MSRCYTPSKGPDGWRALLANPEHWKTGYSAKTLAHCWEAHDRLPVEVASLIKTVPRYADEEPELLIAVPEWEVPLPGGSQGSHNDVLALIGVADELMVAAVEGKVSEPFGDKTIDEWLVGASEGKRKRLEYLGGILGVDFQRTRHLRYQLVHRAASAVMECHRFRGQIPAMVVHSFSPTNAGFEDFGAFVEVLGGVVEANRMAEVNLPDASTLLLGWACGDQSYLTA